MKTRIKFYSDGATGFYSRKITAAGSNHIFWLVILTDSKY